MISRTPDDGKDVLKSLSASARLRVGELVDEYELAQDNGFPVGPEQLCANEPELLEAVVLSLKQLAATEQQLPMIGDGSYPKRIGDFDVLEQIGVGGSGVVFRCQQQNPERQIAVKVLKPTVDAKEQERFFRRELRVFSALTTPGIAEVYVTGVTEWNGAECFWVAMELLDGGRIDEYVSREKLLPLKILTLFRDICATMQAAHRLGIIHRDLKPSNILLSASGVPHVVDFGVAAIASPEHSVTTETGGFCVGTVAWMAPEVVLGLSPKPDTRSDIYSLGTVLFQLLSGRRPYQTKGLTIPEVAQRLMKGPTPLLSSFIGGVSRDLETFVSRMIERDVEYRYQNLDDVVGDVDRILAGEPISVRSVTVPERVWRWCRKNMLLSGISAVAVVAVVSAMIVYFLSARSIQRYADQQQQTNAELTKRTKDLEHSLSLRERGIVNARLGSLAEQLQDNPRDVERKLIDPSQFPPSLRSFGWELLRFQSGTDFRRLQCAESTIRSIQFSHNDRFLASKSIDGKIQLTDLESGERIWEAGGMVKRRFSPLRFSPDDKFVYCIGVEFGVRKHDADSGRLLETLLAEIDCQASLLDLSEDGRWLVTVSGDNQLLLLDLSSNEVFGRELEPDVKIVALWLQNEGQIIRGMTSDGIGKVWFVPSLESHVDNDMKKLHWGFADIRSGTASLSMADGGVHAVISGSAEVLVVRWDARPEPVVQRFSIDEERIDALSLLPPFSVLITGGDGSRVFNMFSGTNRIFREDGRTTRSNAVSTSRKHIAIGDTDGGVGIYRVDIPGRRHTVFGAEQAWPSLDYGPPVAAVSIGGGQTIFTAHKSGVLVKVDSKTQRPVSITPVTSGQLTSLVVSPHETWVACGTGGTSEESGVCVYGCGVRTDEATRQVLNSLQLQRKISTPRVCSMALSEDGRRLFVSHRNGEISAIDTVSWTISHQWQAHPDAIFALAAKRGIVVSADTLGSVKVWRQDDFTLQNQWQAHDKRISCVALSSTLERVFTASHDRTAAIWNLNGGLIQRLTGHAAAVRAVAVSPDENTLATAGEDHLIRLWDAQTGDPQFVLRGHTNTVRSLQFMPSGLLSTSHDSTVSIWGPAGKGSTPR